MHAFISTESHRRGCVPKQFKTVTNTHLQLGAWREEIVQWTQPASSGVRKTGGFTGERLDISPT